MFVNHTEIIVSPNGQTLALELRGVSASPQISHLTLPFTKGAPAGWFHPAYAKQSPPCTPAPHHLQSCGSRVQNFFQVCVALLRKTVNLYLTKDLRLEFGDVRSSSELPPLCLHRITLSDATKEGAHDTSVSAQNESLQQAPVFVISYTV